MKILVLAQQRQDVSFEQIKPYIQSEVIGVRITYSDNLAGLKAKPMLPEG